ncbi:MAG: F0F1 ATP synthase subunit delta [Tannerella sp.]|jgi:F-type H+-transporting ATPase subunit delta|nr:F0F1 ATP synthase subunit delta [Tannerella sp.]
MNEGLISRRYAKALYEYAATRQQEDGLYHRMQLLNHHLSTMPRLKGALDNPAVSLKEKISLLHNAAGGNPEQSYLDFIRLVLANRREKYLQKMTLSYQTLYRKKKNIRMVSLVSAREIQPEILSRIHKDVVESTHGTVRFSTQTDPAIEGGFIFRLDDYRLDASVRNQLEKIRRQFIHKNRTIR